ncbi:hypothetical protein SEMRO_1341_G264480.1 [Seminavis robusta]|uniref:Uncharacterized protein n=1 Tax=Seminavis robusta TaxID=568900 RepID=A0A9N8HU36_9STRA|nr:hypothetical protein SEMRO_1341_G264480.1 [Seminavis robusta]|eukprot:Sro1341_g264480.1 n/a (188) ;mRNA; f:16285-16848
MVSWRVVASLEEHGGETAASVATLVAQVNHGTDAHSIDGPITLQQFGDSPLFRVVIHRVNSNRNAASFVLPPDASWTVTQVKKIKTRKSGRKAIRFEFNLQADGPEGFDSLVITLPWDGASGSAMTFHQASVYASQVVIDWIAEEAAGRSVECSFERSFERLMEGSFVGKLEGYDGFVSDDSSIVTP